MNTRDGYHTLFALIVFQTRQYFRTSFGTKASYICKQSMKVAEQGVNKKRSKEWKKYAMLDSLNAQRLMMLAMRLLQYLHSLGGITANYCYYDSSYRRKIPKALHKITTLNH